MRHGCRCPCIHRELTPVRSSSVRGLERAHAQNEDGERAGKEADGMEVVLCEEPARGKAADHTDIVLLRTRVAS